MRRLLTIGTTLALLLAARPALAEFPSPSFYVGVYGGGNVPLRDWDMRDYFGTPLELTPEASGLFGLRLGFHVASWLALEGEFSYLPVKSTSGDANTVLSYNFNLLVHLMKTNWAPVFEAGLGAYQSVSGDLLKDVDLRGHVGLGLRGLVTKWMALRLNVRDAISDGFDKAGAHNLELYGGLDFFLWRASKDRDGDGILDHSDECPDEAGVASADGCPDADGDGIADKDDACPNEKGTAALKGCPDQDGDGIADRDDRCPDKAGVESLQGCPDSDGDGITDADDACPEEQGPAELKGCPDSDGDGIANKDDACPNEKGPAELKGCPDSDGDGIPDKDDRCPDVAGVKELQGCMPEAAKKFQGAIRGINFAFGSAKITRSSYALLDETVKLLNEYQSMKLRIEGHTDNVGKPDKNQDLSQARADAVRDYLADKGIDSSRLDSTGFGDTKPVAPNKTAKGRAQNRRIEFHISAQ